MEATLSRLLSAMIVLAFALAAGCARDNGATEHEVWVLDQSDNAGHSYGGSIYVFDSSTLDEAGSAAVARRRIDLSGATADLCRTRTGEPPVRPHMIRFNEDQTHVILAFVASGHIVFMDADSGEPADCIRSTRSGTGQQAHAAYPTPDGRFVLVANQNGKRLERIEVDYATSTFTPDSAALLDLAECATPTGSPCEAPGIRPDNAPVCPFMSDGGLAFVTLRGGGLLVVDVRDTPMRIVAEYDSATVKGNGCGGAEVNGRMYVNAGGRPGELHHMDVYGFDVYRFPLDAFDDRTGPLAVNTPAPHVIWTAEGAHDSHGMVATPNGRYVWVFDRHGDTGEVFSTDDGAHVNTVRLNGELTDNAAPDIAAISPDGRRIYVALRGPTPLSGDPHNATGTTPGLGVIHVAAGGRSGRLAAIVRMTNISDGQERADPHSVAVRSRR
jgi:DNA-binding beta-propeller fold protein YncE